MVGNKRLSRGATSNRIHHRSLNLDEIALVKVPTDEGDNLGACHENVARPVIHNEIEISLSVPLLLISEPVVLGRNLVQARRQENNLARENRKLAIVTILGGRAAGEPNDANDITSPELLVLGLERHIASSVLGLAGNLDLDALGADVVEDELGASSALSVDTARDPDFLLGDLFALLQGRVLLEELSQVVLYVELVRVRVGILRCAELVYLLAADLKVLLKKSEPLASNPLDKRSKLETLH